MERGRFDLRYTGVLVLVAAIVAVLGHAFLPASSWPDASRDDSYAMLDAPTPHAAVPMRGPPGRPPGLVPGALPPSKMAHDLVLRGSDALGIADGAVPDGTTVFDDDIPGVANLDPSFLRVLRQAAIDAAGEDVDFVVNSGWRSPEYQERLFQEAIERYGSVEEASRWVSTPATSAHVKGDAVDIGPVSARAWLSERGAAYGLCQIYRNEPWHYELRPQAVARGCPPMYAHAAVGASDFDPVGEDPPEPGRE